MQFISCAECQIFFLKKRIASYRCLIKSPGSSHMQGFLAVLVGVRYNHIMYSYMVIDKIQAH